MGRLFDKATKRDSLRRAWFRIRSNGIRSPLFETRSSIEEFERDAEQNISRLQASLRNHRFVFEDQTGILKQKKSGNKRGIVMAPVRNRIVERAWLDCLQQNVPFIQEVNNIPTSVGGVPDRSVPHGLALVQDAIRSGRKYFIRSDISGFFDHVPRRDVFRVLAAYVDDSSFLEILDKATTVTLGNERALGEDRAVFPTDEEGVAQGSPLSPLFGNILLHEFDKSFNARGLVCVRFIDDFIMFAKREADVRKTFNHARIMLGSLGLKCHDPYDSSTAPEKGQYGHVDRGFVFLGYDIRPGLIQPSRKARASLLEKIDNQIRVGKRSIYEVEKAENSFARRQRYIQALDVIDRVIRGWGDAFSYSNASSTISDLDECIDKKLKSFRSWYMRKTHAADWKQKRRTMGICLLQDVSPKSLDMLPFRFPKQKLFRATRDLVVVSTDGSVIGLTEDAGGGGGSGGWAAVFHSDLRTLCGHALSVTNNQMELTAVVEAIKATPAGSRVRVITDSKYVSRAVSEGGVVRSNIHLWQSLLKLINERRVEVRWLRGHSGDFFNEEADRRAKEQAEMARKRLLRVKTSCEVKCSKQDILGR